MPQYRIEVVIDPTAPSGAPGRSSSSLDRINDRAGVCSGSLLVHSPWSELGLQSIRLLNCPIPLSTCKIGCGLPLTASVGIWLGTLDDVTAVAVRTRAPVLALAGVYQRGSIAAKELNASQEELIRLAEIAGKAVAIQGGGLQTARGALTQLSQTLGQSVVRGEEFNSILEGAFPIALAAARGIERVGGSVGRLRTEIIEGG